jgi:hypothetical protein
MESFIRVWRHLHTPGICRHCKKKILWAITDQNKRWPFEAGTTAVRIDTHPATGARFDVFEAAKLHARSCEKRPPKPKTPRRTRAAQPRLL